MSELRGAARRDAKLTVDDVRLVRSLVAERRRLRAILRELSDRALAKKFEVAPATIYQITSFTTWKYVR